LKTVTLLHAIQWTVESWKHYVRQQTIQACFWKSTVVKKERYNRDVPNDFTTSISRNKGIPSAITRSTTYSTVDLYLFDLLMCHNNRIHYQLNSIHNQDDGNQQLVALTMMRAILPHFIRRNYCHRPFVFTLTDLHQSNIFVNDK